VNDVISVRGRLTVCVRYGRDESVVVAWDDTPAVWDVGGLAAGWRAVYATVLGKLDGQ
jgi:hypothetical protein